MTTTAQKYLEQIQRIRATISNLDSQIERLRNEEASVRSAWPDGQPHGAGTTDPVGNAAAKLADELVDLEFAQLEWRRELHRKEVRIIELLSRLRKPEHNRLLYLRYVEGWTWEAIAEEMNRSYQWVADSVRGLHGNALQEFDKILQEIGVT